VKHFQKTKVLVLTGPTASGKTSLAVSLARRFNGEILSVDSRQVYKGMDLGTGKDLEQYGLVPYHLINLLDPTEEFSVSRFQTLALQTLAALAREGALPILCGGSGHYLKALLQDYPFPHLAHNPHFSAALEGWPQDTLAQVLDQLGDPGPRDSKRRMARRIEKAKSPVPLGFQAPNFRELYLPKVFVLTPERSWLRQRIQIRLQERMDQGLVEEVQRLLEPGQVDILTFTSSATVHNFAGLIGKERFQKLAAKATVASIGPITTATLAEYGITPQIEPGAFTIPALAAAIVDYFAGKASGKQ